MPHLQPSLFDLHEPETLAGKARAVAGWLRGKSWQKYPEIEIEFPWITRQKMSEIVQAANGEISSCTRGYKSTRDLSEQEFEEADHYLRAPAIAVLVRAKKQRRLWKTINKRI